MYVRGHPQVRKGKHDIGDGYKNTGESVFGLCKTAFPCK